MSEKKRSILIIDDDRSSLMALTDILHPDYELYLEIDSAEAIMTAENCIPDIILLDILMPGPDGYDVISKLKASEKTKNIPVIFITGLESTDLEEKGFALGAVEFISKPFHQAVVKMRIHHQITILDLGGYKL